ncbi:HAD-IIB family hydrolase [bacterium]|nr:HAD-IIB family hydrolase [bacterium]
MTSAELSSVRGVCLDIDDTLSTHGKLTASAFHALWKLKEAGFAVVPVTGRPAGWCDHIARFWPVDAVVGENGAFSLFMHGGSRKRLTTPGAVSDPRPALERLGEKIRKRFPHACWASDQAYREYDLAIDFCEDVQAWPREDIDELVRICEAEGAHAKVSSIHVNTWFGDYDKHRGFTHLLTQFPGQLMPLAEQWLFIGDSPNDEPLFARFEHSVGVANLREFVARLRHPPRWVTARESGAGFVEMADLLVSKKAF